VIARYPGHSSPITCVEVLEGSEDALVLTGSEGGEVKMWDNKNRLR